MIHRFLSEFPFEICALEVLEAICSLLDARTREFETPGYVALDELTSKAYDSFLPILTFTAHYLNWKNTKSTCIDKNDKGYKRALENGSNPTSINWRFYER
ncbi:hypothetical protein Fmac_017705 [Flemingia macrophylla]|uniref:Uncharacterized protein n=1 Tax=Flemingia macrophylla TaxID=520843 RepID=A0ABD1M2U9_9FABA